MNTQTGKGQAVASTAPACVPCEIPAFCRNHYYTGKLLTERDFTDEQRYAMDKMRLHHAALHGWGVVCGLEVKPHPVCPDRRLVVEAGLAIDDCGHEIRVVAEVQLELPKDTSKQQPKRPYPPDPVYEGGESGDNQEPKGKDLYICLSYCESETEYAPAPFDEYGCNTNGQRPGRICERYELSIVDEEPHELKHVREHMHCDSDDCLDIYERLLRQCAKGGHIACIPIAVVRGWVAGEVVIPSMIDNSIRPVLPSTHAMDLMIRCILERLPKPPQLTRIIHLNWTHGEEYHCHDFIRFFVGSHEAARGLEIEFEGKVRPEGLNARSFQAMVVWRPAESSEPRRMEIAPARVVPSPEGTKCMLYIDPGYAKKSLDGKSFDLFITLKCDVVIDEKGSPVDGNLMARLDEDDYAISPPTGDGVPGGLFESWVRVRSTGDEHRKNPGTRGYGEAS